MFKNLILKIQIWLYKRKKKKNTKNKDPWIYEE